METHTSSFAFIFLCFFDFRLSTFSHGPSAVSPSVGISSESEMRGDVFSLFEGTDEGEECRFMMVVAFWEMKRLSAGTCSAHSSSSIQPFGDNHHGWRKYSLTLGLSRAQLLPWRKVDKKSHQRTHRKLLWWPLSRCQPLLRPLHPSIGRF